jgi:hypothetical protein
MTFHVHLTERILYETGAKKRAQLYFKYFPNTFFPNLWILYEFLAVCNRHKLIYLYRPDFNTKLYTTYSHFLNRAYIL